MSRETWSQEIESPVAAARLFKASMLDWHNLGPKVLPDIIISGASVSGDGTGVTGSVRQLNFSSAMPFSFIKERLDFIDHENLECKRTLVEGGALGTKFESASFHFKFEPAAGNGGCVVQVMATFTALEGDTFVGETGKTEESVKRMIKATEAYLVANPTAYL